MSVEDSIIVEVLAALGVDASDQGAIEAALEDVRMREWRRVIPPVFVTWTGESRRLWVHLPHGESVTARVVFNDGTTRALTQMDWWVDPVEVDGVLTGEASFEVPSDLPIGWHRIEVSTSSLGTPGTLCAECPLAVAPSTLDPASVMNGQQWGLMVQIYSWPSSDSWGIGNAHDVATVASWSARDHGAGFILVNPCHAPVPDVPSPYLPSSRRVWDPLMIRPEDIPEYRELNEVDRLRIDSWRHDAQGDIQHADASTRINRHRSWKYLRQALLVIFQSGRSPDRQQAFEAFSQQQPVRDYALWKVLADQYGPDYRSWPAALHDPSSLPVAQFAQENATDIAFEVWLQWIVSGQLADVQHSCQDAGMSIGVISDLAVGVHPGGADAWALASVMAQGVGVGAPPDMYNQRGQNWDQPPWRPQALAEAGFAPFREVLRAALHGAGAVRIDHILGLFRMWWIPEGRPATEGTYVGFDHDALLALTCLEAHLAGAVVIGEDLGTLEPWVQHELARRGILGTVISWFEKSDTDAPLPIEEWRTAALASVTVHDLPPTAGYLAGEHVRIRAELGLLAGDVEDEWAAAARERHAWAQVLRERGYLSHDVNVDTAHGREEMVIALYRALGDSPSVLIGVGASDLLGDRRAQNQPGTDQEYPNWRMPMADGAGHVVLLDEFLADPPPLARTIAGAMRR